jgi:membrane-bound lytic murein transglycosylase MltF
MYRKLILGFSILSALTLASAPPAAAAPPGPKTRMALTLPNEKWTGDLDGMIKRRMVRVLVVFSKTFFFIDKGTQRGATYDAFRKFEDELNLKLKTKHIRVNVVFIPVSRDELLPALQEGRGDIAAANLTVTEARDQLVDFSDAVSDEVAEILVTGPESPPVAGIEELAGKEVFVRRSSSYHESLTALNERFKQEGRPAVKLIAAPENLEDEDLMEMLNAGLVSALVVDDHKARFWKQIFPKLTLHEDIALRTGGRIAWAMRANSPLLKAELDGFIKKYGQGTAFGNEVFRRYLKSTRYVKNSTSETEMKKFLELVKFFRTYGDTYGMDWVLMAAQGYQESRLDQNAKSPVGAVGVMQVMPATGKEMRVGDIRQTEPNIHAGVKYIRFMVDQYFKDEPMDDLNKGLFAFAAYNAGPGRVRQLRREAAKRGLDPNLWFNHVELVAAEKIGRETVTYVSNIYKYYIAYALTQQEYLERREAMEKLQGGEKQK